jgi:hypothetical protein
MLLPDGRRCWFFAGRLEADAVGGGHEQLPWDAQRSPVSMRGFGIQLDGVDAPIYDLIRRRAIATGAARADFVLVLPEAWLVADRVEPDLGKPQLDRGTHAPVPSLRAADQLVTVQQDGQVIVRNTDGDPANRGLFRVDPVSDRRQRLVTEGLDVSKAAGLRGSWTYAPDPAGCILSLLIRGRSRRVYLPADSDSLTVLLRGAGLCWRAGDGSDQLYRLSVRDYFARLERFDSATGKGRVVFSLE